MDTHVHAEFLRMRGTYGLTGGKAVSYTAKSSMAYQVISELNQPCPDSDTGTREGYSSEVSERGNLKRVREAAEETPYPEEALARGKTPGRKASGSQKKTETPPQTPEPRALPLHDAVRNGNREAVRRLLDEGADVQERDRELNTALHEAARCPRRLLLRATAPDIRDRAAAKAGDAEQDSVAIARMLLEHGADMSAKNRLGETPLHVAVRHGLSEMVRLLLEHGAPVNRRDAESNTAMDVAVSCRQAECRRLLSEAGGWRFRLHPLRVWSIRALISFCCWVPLSSIGLLFACGYDNHLLVRFLQPTAWLMPQGWLVYGAVDTDDPEKALLLIRGGADPNTEAELRGGIILPVLMLSIQKGFRDVSLELLRHGADPGAPFRYTHGPVIDTPLLLALSEGQLDVARALIERGAPLDVADYEIRFTPLLAAARFGHTEMVELLLDRGADIHAKAYCSNTALHLAIRAGHTDTARILVERGAQVDVRDDRGYTPLDEAVKAGNAECEKLLREAMGRENSHLITIESSP